MACYTAWHRMMKVLLHTFTLIIRLFEAYEVSTDISDASQVLISVEFDFVLKSWSSTSRLT